MKAKESRTVSEFRMVVNKLIEMPTVMQLRQTDEPGKTALYRAVEKDMV